MPANTDHRYLSIIAKFRKLGFEGFRPIAWIVAELQGLNYISTYKVLIEGTYTDSYLDTLEDTVNYLSRV